MANEIPVRESGFQRCGRRAGLDSAPPAKKVHLSQPNALTSPLLVAFDSDGLKVSVANSELEARTMASERAIRRRRERMSQGSMTLPSQGA